MADNYCTCNPDTCTCMDKAPVPPCPPRATPYPPTPAPAYPPFPEPGKQLGWQGMSPNGAVFPFQPVFGKFNLSTYVQGASDYEIMAMLIQKYNDMARYINSIQNNYFAKGGEHNLYDTPEVEYTITASEDNGTRYLTVSNSKIYFSSNTILNLHDVPVERRRAAVPNCDGLFLLVWDNCNNQIIMIPPQNVRWDTLILGAYDVYFKASKTTTTTDSDGNTTSTETTVGVPDVIEVWGSSRVGETWDYLENIESNLNAEIERAKAAEDTLQSNIDAVQDNLDDEIARAKAAEQANADAIKAETARAEAAEEKLTTDLAAETAARIAGDEKNQSGLNTEVQERKEADAALQAAIDAEKSRAEAAEDKLTTDLAAEIERATSAENTLSDGLAEEIARAKAAEKVLTDTTADMQEQITSNDEDIAALQAKDTEQDASIKANTDGLAEEITRAKAAEEQLESDIHDEILNRQTADSALNDSISAEATSRANADSALAALITAETTNRTAADTDLQNQIDRLKTSVSEDIAAETAEREAADKELGESIAALEAKALSYAIPFNENVYSTDDNLNLILDNDCTYYAKGVGEFTIPAGTYSNSTGITTESIYYVKNGDTAQSKLVANVQEDDIILAIISI